LTVTKPTDARFTCRRKQETIKGEEIQTASTNNSTTLRDRAKAYRPAIFHLIFALNGCGWAAGDRNKNCRTGVDRPLSHQEYSKRRAFVNVGSIDNHMILIKELAKCTVMFCRVFRRYRVGRLIAARNRMGMATTTARNTRIAMQAKEVGMMQRRT